MSRRFLVAATSVLAVAICVAFGIGNVVSSLTDWRLADVDAYWNAAMRLRNGEPLYTAFQDVNAAEVYRYAPWFAVAWVPLTFLPRTVVEIAWSIVLVGASVTVIAAVLSERSRASIAIAFLVASFLFVGAKFGNVHPLMIAALAFGAERRSGPLWIALAASLKATPILYVLVYLGRRQWWRAAATVGLTAVLVLPMFLLGIGDYTADPGMSHSLYAVSPAVFGAVAVTSVVIAAWVSWRFPRYAWLAVSVAAILTLPRYFEYELTYLLVGALPVIGLGRMIDTPRARA